MDGSRQYESLGHVRFWFTFEWEGLKPNVIIIFVSLSVVSTGKSDSSFEYSHNNWPLRMSNDTQVEEER